MPIPRRNRVSAEFSMSSMTDIVFLLLIFFMLTSTLVSPNALKLFLPSSSSKTQAPQTISVAIDKDINYYVEDQKMPFENIESALVSRISNIPDATIVLKVDKSVPTEYLVNVMDIANRNQFKMILATSPKQ
ncbi:MAG: ExbD/TolR family protein [Flavobacteriales bacterium]